jgi:hypothetical protein
VNDLQLIVDRVRQRALLDLGPHFVPRLFEYLESEKVLLAKRTGHEVTGTNNMSVLGKLFIWEVPGYDASLPASEEGQRRTMAWHIWGVVGRGGSWSGMEDNSLAFP